MATPSPFHSGEQAVQERVGVREEIEPWGRKVVRPFMPDQHREFFAQLPFMVAVARDAQRRPWATLLTGTPGFARTPDETQLQLNTQLLPGDALTGALTPGQPVGLLGIELDTRRRNRVNGEVLENENGTIKLKVNQSFGNCPQYITERVWQQVEPDKCTSTVNLSQSLTQDQRQWIGNADTFFIGSGHQDPNNPRASGMDASHRGGPSGFVKVTDANHLVFPDYSGNNYFNTLGNLLVDPQVALLFIDFEQGNLLQLTGHAEIDWDSPEVALHQNAQRLVRVTIDEVVELKGALPLRFTKQDLLATPLKLVGKTPESKDVTSFYFESFDGSELPVFSAGQHLPLALDIDGKTVTRTYSLSNGPNATQYRISVKRESHGLVSRWLHDRVQVGDVLRTGKPKGDFILENNTRPVVLIGGGIGVTPLVSMLHELTQKRDHRPIVFLQGARNSQFHPLAERDQSPVTG